MDSGEDTVRASVGSRAGRPAAARRPAAPFSAPVGRWESKVEDGSGTLQILHTGKDLVARIIERTNKEHPDDTPQIPAIPVTDANPGYRDWLLSSAAK